MAVVQVGELYQPNRTEYPEGCEYNFYANGHELRLLYNSPSRQEIDAVKRGKANFAFTVQEDVIFLLWQFKPEPWADAPYSYWVVPESSRVMPQEIEDGKGALLQIILIDAATGIVKAIRGIGLETEFSRSLHSAISNQMQNPVSPQQYSNAVDRVYAKFPNTMSLLDKAVAHN